MIYRISLCEIVSSWLLQPILVNFVFYMKRLTNVICTFVIVDTQDIWLVLFEWVLRVTLSIPFPLAVHCQPLRVNHRLIPDIVSYAKNGINLGFSRGWTYIYKEKSGGMIAYNLCVQWRNAYTSVERQPFFLETIWYVLWLGNTSTWWRDGWMRSAKCNSSAFERKSIKLSSRIITF